jgi:hypothetical protein
LCAAKAISVPLVGCIVFLNDINGVLAIANIGIDMNVGIGGKKTWMGLPRGRSRKTLVEIEKGTKRREPDIGHGLAIRYPESLNLMLFEDLDEKWQSTAQNRSIKLRNVKALWYVYTPKPREKKLS